MMTAVVDPCSGEEELMRVRYVSPLARLTTSHHSWMEFVAWRLVEFGFCLVLVGFLFFLLVGLCCFFVAVFWFALFGFIYFHPFCLHTRVMKLIMV